MKDDFLIFLKTIDLFSIQPIKVNYERKVKSFLKDRKIHIESSMVFPEKKYNLIEDKVLEIQPYFEISILDDKKVLYSHNTTVEIDFQIIDFPSFSKYWENDDIKTLFFKKQIKKLIWPILRQQVLDGMSRVGLPSVTLPFMM